MEEVFWSCVIILYSRLEHRCLPVTLAVSTSSVWLVLVLPLGWLSVLLSSTWVLGELYWQWNLCSASQGKYPYMTGVRSSQVPATIMRKCPLITGCPFIGISLDGFNCMQYSLSLGTICWGGNLWSGDFFSEWSCFSVLRTCYLGNLSCRNTSGILRCPLKTGFTVSCVYYVNISALIMSCIVLCHKRFIVFDNFSGYLLLFNINECII